MSTESLSSFLNWEIVINHQYTVLHEQEQENLAKTYKRKGKKNLININWRMELTMGK